MKILDRYIVRTYVLSLAIVLAALMGLSLLLDVFFNYNKLLDLASSAKQTGFWTILAGLADYYFYKIFNYFQLLAAMSLLAAAAASLVWLNRHRELVGVKAAGISLYRVMWPMIAVALLIDGFYLANQEIVIPSIAVQLARNPDDLEIQKEFSVEFIRDENNNILYAPLYNPKTMEMLSQQKFPEDRSKGFWARVRIFLRDSKFQARGTIEADRARWDPEAHGWRLTNGLRLPPLKEAEVTERIPTGPEGDPVDFYATNVGPAEVLRHRDADAYRYMAYGELKALSEDPMRGNRRQLQVAMHQHVTGPIMNLLLLLLGLPFVAVREDRNYFVGIGVAVALGIGVFAVTFASTAFGNAGHLSPLLAAWLPVFVVLPASILSMEALRT
jgi:lipopolysaccharide export system permease protein